MSRVFHCPPDWPPEKVKQLNDWVNGELAKEEAPAPVERERFGQSALPRFNRYSIPHKARPGEVECPYCVKRPVNLQAHCRAQHPDKPEAR
jgi:hypothetical protein